MKALRTLLMTAILVLSVSGLALAADNMTRKIDSFDFLVDYSGSMMLKNTTLKQAKIEVAKDVLQKINAEIPNLGYNASMHTVAPAASVLPYAAWNPANMSAAINTLKDNFDVFGRLTPMGSGIQANAAHYAQMAAPKGIILVSDGLNNLGTNPVQDAAAIYSAQPNTCFHIISLADTAEGQATLENIAKLSNCSVSVNAVDLATNPAAVTQFVKDVFYNVNKVAVEDVVVLRGVNFAFDSSALDTNSKSILNEATKLLQENSKPIMLRGYTDSIGTDAYNMGLSQRRADSVKAYLIEQGITSGRINAKGEGKSFKYDNATEEGRYMNRRTEISFD